jgi:phage tail-like protein
VNRGRWLIDQLPVAMVEDDFLVRFAGIFQDLADTLVVQADTMEHLIDTAVSPPSMVRWLATWIGAGGVGDNGIDPDLPEELQRRIVREHGQVLPWRGTARGVRQLLALNTSGTIEITDSGGVYAEGQAPDNPGHVTIHLTSTESTDEDLLDLVRDELPATVSFELLVGDRRLWPPDGA